MPCCSQPWFPAYSSQALLFPVNSPTARVLVGCNGGTASGAALASATSRGAALHIAHDGGGLPPPQIRGTVITGFCDGWMAEMGDLGAVFLSRRPRGFC